MCTTPYIVYELYMQLLLPLKFSLKNNFKSEQEFSNFRINYLPAPHGNTITPDLARPFPNIFLRLFS